MRSKTLQDIFSNINCPVIVEGKKDREALKKFNFDIITIYGSSLYEKSEYISNFFSENREVLILTDFDKEGKKIAKKMNHFLESFGVKVDNKTRSKIKLMVKSNKIEDISFEGDDLNGKSCSEHNKIYYKIRFKDRWNDRKARYNRRNIRTNGRFARI